MIIRKISEYQNKLYDLYYSMGFVGNGDESQFLRNYPTDEIAKVSYLQWISKFPSKSHCNEKRLSKYYIQDQCPMSDQLLEIFKSSGKEYKPHPTGWENLSDEEYKRKLKEELKDELAFQKERQEDTEEWYMERNALSKFGKPKKISNNDLKRQDLAFKTFLKDRGMRLHLRKRTIVKKPRSKRKPVKCSCKKK